MDTLTINNFLPHPMQVRAWALQQEFLNCQQFTQRYNVHTDWPGSRTSHVYELDNIYGDATLTAVSNIITKMTGRQGLSIRSYFQLTTENDGDSWVHQDNDVDYAALLYLNPNADPVTGTTLYRCNDVTRWTSYMNDQAGYNKLKQINTKDDIQLYEELFTPIDIIGNIFNRLVIYKGDIYHKSNKYFGNTKEDSRLTQVFFITFDK
jgi:hypothetical protein